jgi:hypothetical protein
MQGEALGGGWSGRRSDRGPTATSTVSASPANAVLDEFVGACVTGPLRRSTSRRLVRKRAVHWGNCARRAHLGSQHQRQFSGLPGCRATRKIRVFDAMTATNDSKDRDLEGTHVPLQWTHLPLHYAGSSLIVYSGFRFVEVGGRRGIPIAAVRLGRSRADDLLALKMVSPVHSLACFGRRE